MSTRPARQPMSPAITRLASLADLDTDAQAALELATQRPRHTRRRRELIAEGEEITATHLILSGWAARVRILEDGRRQIIQFLLPGDLIGHHGQDRPVASSSVVAITELDSCSAPSAALSPTMAQAYAHSRALEDAYLLSQVTRLGRLNAHERLADLLLELHERLELGGLAAKGRFSVPVTQEMIADALGLTSVHVNRTIQDLRREGSVEWKGREVHLPEPEALRRRTGRSPIRVTAA